VLALWLGIILVSATDIRFRIIPKHINFALILVLLIGHPERSRFFVATFLLCSTLRILSKFSLGYGDIRLASAISLLSSSWENCIYVNSVVWVIAGGWVVLGRQFLVIEWGKTLPFAPFLALSAILEAR